MVINGNLYDSMQQACLIDQVDHPAVPWRRVVSMAYYFYVQVLGFNPGQLVLWKGLKPEGLIKPGQNNLLNLYLLCILLGKQVSYQHTILT